MSYIQMMSHTAADEHRPILRFEGPRDSSVRRLHLGQPGPRLRLRGHPLQAPDADARRRRRGLSAASAAVFDTLFATSTRNDEPTLTPRPFDRTHDGLVVGEGAATLVLEEYEHAKARGAHILAEIVGYGTNADGSHITQPERETMAVAMRLALADAGLAPEAIGYVSAHGTATDRGDIAESQATADVFGHAMPISSMKSYLGHSLGACGAIEAWWAIEMMRRGWFAPTLNLSDPDPACAELDHLAGEAQADAGDCA